MDTSRTQHTKRLLSCSAARHKSLAAWRENMAAETVQNRLVSCDELIRYRGLSPTLRSRVYYFYKVLFKTVIGCLGVP